MVKSATLLFALLIALGCTQPATVPAPDVGTFRHAIDSEKLPWHHESFDAAEEEMGTVPILELELSPHFPMEGEAH